MELILQRDLRRRWFATQYILHITFVLDEEELRPATLNNLTNYTLYQPPTVQTYEHDAERAFNRCRQNKWTSIADTEQGLIDLTAAVFHRSRSFFSFRLTLADAVAGASVGCPDFYAMLSCEEEIAANFDRVAELLDNALAFETEREQVLIPDNAVEADGVPPADWANHANWRG